MDKNTIWAIVLSFLVIVVSAIFFTPKLKTTTATETATEQTAVTQTTETTELTENKVEDLSAVLGTTDEDLVATEETKQEEKITIKTNKAEIVITTKGADIISYTLDPETHKDFETGIGVQLSDNITDVNRTCAISLGRAENNIINGIFDVKKIDDYTYLFTKDLIVNNKKITLGKKYTFTPDEYMFKLDVLIHDESGAGIDSNGAAYTIRTSPQIGPHFNRKQNKYENRQFIAYNGKKAKKQILTEGAFKHWDKEFMWGGIAGKYFLELVIPTDSTIVSNAAYSTQYEIEDYANAQAMIERKSFIGSDIQDTYYMYFGPRNEKDIQIYNVSDNNHWKLAGFKLSESLQSSGWLSWLETILKWCLQMLHIPFKNWGVCIILLTLILKIILFPLSKKQSLGTLKMQELQPQIQAIQKKYANDQQKQQAEMAKIYQEAHYNPASGCLPLIFQFLILFAMYNLFNNYFEFRGASFITGWIPDLSSGDSVYAIKKDIPVLTTVFGVSHIRILPVIYVATQLLSGKITQNGGMNGTNAASMKFMTYGLPLFFFFIFYNAPSGLLLYWLTSNVLQILQQIVINKLMAEKRSEMANKKAVPAKTGKKK